MRNEIRLDPTETVPERPFTDPEHTARDEAALRQLLEHERERARAWTQGEAPAARESSVVRELDANGFRHLLVVPDTRALLEAESPAVVGFFGRPRSDADVPLLFELEEELIASMDHAEGLLSYYDVELVKGAYGNLILFADADGPRAWSGNEVHRRAVHVSPGSYHEIRLHHGTLSGSFLDGDSLRITRTRYIDYTGDTPWFAVRETPV